MAGEQKSEYDSILNTHLVFQFTEDFEVPLDQMGVVLLGEIVTRLEEKGIKWTKTRSSFLCNKVKCEIDDAILTITLVDFQVFSNTNKRMSVLACTRSFAWWKMLLRLVSASDYVSGEPLYKLLLEVKDVVDKDVRFKDRKWMTQEEFRMFTRGGGK